MGRPGRASWVTWAVLLAAATIAPAIPAAAGGTSPSFVTTTTYPYPQNAPGPISCVGPRFCMQITFGMLPADETLLATVHTTDNAGTSWTSLGRLPSRLRIPGGSRQRAR